MILGQTIKVGEDDRSACSRAAGWLGESSIPALSSHSNTACCCCCCCCGGSRCCCCCCGGSCCSCCCNTRGWGHCLTCCAQADWLEDSTPHNTWSSAGLTRAGSGAPGVGIGSQTTESPGWKSSIKIFIKYKVCLSSGDPDSVSTSTSRKKPVMELTKRRIRSLDIILIMQSRCKWGKKVDFKIFKMLFKRDRCWNQINVLHLSNLNFNSTNNVFHFSYFKRKYYWRTYSSSLAFPGQQLKSRMMVLVLRDQSISYFSIIKIITVLKRSTIISPTLFSFQSKIDHIIHIINQAMNFSSGTL